MTVQHHQVVGFLLILSNPIEGLNVKTDPRGNAVNTRKLPAMPNKTPDLCASAERPKCRRLLWCLSLMCRFVHCWVTQDAYISYVYMNLYMWYPPHGPMFCEFALCFFQCVVCVLPGYMNACGRASLTTNPAQNEEAAPPLFVSSISGN